MRWLTNYIKSCFCKHEWELIFENQVNETEAGIIVSRYGIKTYRCKTCGYSKKYKSY